MAESRGPKGARAAMILDAAEARIRLSGYAGFSFREVAADVGIKSASVHHHFPTKADLGAAVARRYRERFLAHVAAQIEVSGDVVAVWTQMFREASRADGRMCLCGVLAAESADLPEAVAEQARRFFTESATAIDLAIREKGSGFRLLAQLEGALLIAQAVGDPEVFEIAVQSA